MLRDPDRAGQFHFPFDTARGRIPREPALLRAAFEATRGSPPGGGPEEHGDANGPRLLRDEEPQFSPLLRIPLAESAGGLPHRGLDIFAGPEDPDYRTLLDWVRVEIDAHPAARVPLSEPEAFFRDHVLGVMSRNGCFLASCHGPDVFNDLKLTPPMPAGAPPPAGFSRRMIQANREAMLGRVCRFANLGGDLARSRLIVKNLPLAEGGVHQRGGNQQFFESLEDPDVQVLLHWLRLERKALAVQLTTRGGPVGESALGRLQGLAFIRSPARRPATFFDLDAFHPGADVHILPLSPGEEISEAAGPARNLTARYHPEGPVAIQGLDVRYDGRAILFSMRRDAESGFRIHEVRLDSDLRPVEGTFRQITFAPVRRADGSLIHHIDPLYIPGPDDPEGVRLDEVAVVYASNEAGAQVASEPWALVGEADGGDRLTLIDAQRTEAPPSLEGRPLQVVRGPGRGARRRIVKHEQDPASVCGSRLVLDRPLPYPPDRRTVYVIEGARPSYRPAYDLWRTVPGPPDPRTSFETTARRMTFTSAQERRPTMRTSGEVMFTSVRNVGYQAGLPVYNGAIYRVMAGGFDYHIQGGNRSRYPLLADSRELPSGLEVRLALDPRNLWGGGSLLLADHGLGVNIEPDNPIDHLACSEQGLQDGSVVPSIPRFLPTQFPLFPTTGERAVTHTGRSPGGAWRDPYPLPDGRILAAHARGPVDHLSPERPPDWDLATIEFDGPLQSADGRHPGPFVVRTLPGASEPGTWEYAPRPIVVRLKEKPVTHQKFIAGVEPKRVDGVLRAPPDTPGQVECYDYPLLESFLTSFAPSGPRQFKAAGSPSAIEPDADHRLRYVRIVQHVPPDALECKPTATAGDPLATAASLGIHGRKLIIAEVPLEGDGSFYAEVPTEVPLLFQGLNRDRMALHTMNRWFYLQPGEKLTFSIPRSIFPLRCAGCHGSLTGRPADVFGPPDLVTRSSRVMANWNEETQEKRPPHGKGWTPGEAISVDFRRDLQPILDRHCSRCHGEPAGTRRVAPDLRGTPTKHYTIAYESLHQLTDPASGVHGDKRYINEREGLAIESFLMEVLLGRELDAPAALASSHPHPEEDPLPPEDLLTVLRWLDLGAPFLGGRPEPAPSPTARTRRGDA